MVIQNVADIIWIDRRIAPLRSRIVFRLFRFIVVMFSVYRLIHIIHMHCRMHMCWLCFSIVECRLEKFRIFQVHMWCKTLVPNVGSARHTSGLDLGTCWSTSVHSWQDLCRRIFFKKNLSWGTRSKQIVHLSWIKIALGNGKFQTVSFVHIETIHASQI